LPFDTVDHGILYDKLKVASFADTAVDWLKSYLSQRTQVTAIGNIHSTVKSVQVGVPQGSVLGPLLFIIYVNDIPLCIKHCNVLLYADDTVIYFSSFDDIEDKLNSDIANLSRWLNENLLTLNKAKGKFVVFGCQQKVAKIHQISLEINGLAVDGEVRSTSYAVLPYVKGLTEPLIETHSKTSRHPSNYETSPHTRTNVSLNKRPTTTCMRTRRMWSTRLIVQIARGVTLARQAGPSKQEEKSTNETWKNARVALISRTMRGLWEAIDIDRHWSLGTLHARKTPITTQNICQNNTAFCSKKFKFCTIYN
jgi:hypothetical protein